MHTSSYSPKKRKEKRGVAQSFVFIIVLTIEPKIIIILTRYWEYLKSPDIWFLIHDFDTCLKNQMVVAREWKFVIYEFLDSKNGLYKKYQEFIQLIVWYDIIRALTYLFDFLPVFCGEIDFIFECFISELSSIYKHSHKFSFHSILKLTLLLK